MRLWILCTMIVFLIASPVFAQNFDVLGTIDEILKSLTELKDQISTIASDLGEQAEVLTDLDTRLEELDNRFPQIQQSMDLVENLRSQLAPLIERFPEVEQHLSSLDTLQSSLADRYDQLNSNLDQLSSSISLNPNSELNELQAQIQTLKNEKETETTRADQLSARITHLEILIYISLALVLALIGLHVFQFTRKKQRQI